MATTQVCPNCQKVHDVGIFVTGQRIRCACGILFDVRRRDVSSSESRMPDSRMPTTVPGREGMVAAGGALQGFAGARPPYPDEPLEGTFVSQASSRLEIPGYQLVELIGRGGMGEVWRAVQQSLGRTVAVKVLPQKLARDPEFVTRFEKEATALASLSHPNIIQIIDRGMTSEGYYFVMEFVPGRSLRELLNAGPLVPDEALRIISQICRAIDYAHEQKIIHRDLKPENILLDERGHVKVADFGLAGIQLPDSRLQLTATAVAMGTVNYMAPEQRRDAKNVDGRADLYSLGVMLYELLTGELPIGRFKLPSEKIAGLDFRLDAVVTKALETDPAARYQRASVIGSELESLIGGVGSITRPDRPVPPSGDSPATRRSSVSVIQSSWNGLRSGLVVVGALAVLGVLTRWWVGDPHLTIDRKNGDQLILGATGIQRVPHTADAGVMTFPPNTDGELMASVVADESSGERSDLWVTFDPGTEEINAHAGSWTLSGGRLSALQAGSQTDGKKLVPRAYLAHRYYSADDFSVEVDLRIRALPPGYALEEEAQRFGEVAFRIKDLQVSLFAIHGTGMRLLWRYFTPDGVEVTGNSARDLEDMVEDEMPVPPDGEPVRLRLTLRRSKHGVEVEGFANGQRFAHKVLLGLEGQVGKVALGCRNLFCDFDNLKVAGRPQQRPGRAPPAAASRGQ